MSLPGTSTKTFEHNATPEADYMFSLNRLFAFAVPGIVGSNQGSTNAFGSFGKAPLVQSTCVVPVSEYTRVGQLVPSMDGRVVTIRARVSNTRAKGKIAFLVLRHTFFTVQAVFSTGGDICKELIQFVGKINPESIVDLKGKVTVPPNPVAGTTQSHVELQGISIHLISEALPVLPFQLADAAAVETSSVVVNADTRLDARWLDNRTPANMGIFSLQSKLCQYFRDFLLQKCFQEIHTPKINVTATEGAGASVFKLDYFGKPAFLAQSPQLYKQMALQGDMEPGVFEVGPVFRSENANTHRHLTEFVGLDVEMILYNHYYEVLDLAEELFHSVFKILQEKNADLIAHVATQFPHSPLVYAVPSDKVQKLGIGILEEDIASTDRYKAFVRNRACPSLRLNFEKAVEFLNENLPENERVDPFEDLNTTNEKLLGRLVQERYGVDFYIVDEYPSAVRPFYTMPHPKNVKLSNSYDMFLRGEEISSGAQRIHDAQLLIDLCKQKGMDVAPINDYINCFRLGAWPHGGFGVGMERVVMLFLGLKNIRQTSLYPRDPRRVTP